jgi:hypothetical protein
VTPNKGSGPASHETRLRRLPARGAGPRTSAPIPTPILATLFGLSLGAWLAASTILVFASSDLAHADPFTGHVVVSVTPVVLPSAVAAAGLHLLPVMLRTDLRRHQVLRALPPFLSGGFLVAVGVGGRVTWITWLGAVLLTLGPATVLWQLTGLL